MKTLLLFTITLLIKINSYSQAFEGEWEGTGSITIIHYPTQWRVKLYFKPINDSGYNVFSYSRGQDKYGKDTIIVSKVIFHKTAEDSIFLEEVEVLRPMHPSPSNCLVKMSLKIIKKKDETFLNGEVLSNQKGCNFSGDISFRRIK